MTEQFKTALIRGAIGAVILAGVAFFSVLGSTDQLQSAEIAAGAAFFGQLAIRGLAEGWIDSAGAKATANLPPGGV
jgi:hypothetical protein